MDSMKNKSRVSITDEYLDLIDLITGSIAVPAIAGIHLPKIVELAKKPDEFGFIFLQDGSVGPFYTSLDNTLTELWQHFPDGKRCSSDTLSFLKYLTGDSLALRAVAWGVFNALSQHVMTRANYSPVATDKTSSVGVSDPEKGEKVCMVGCFAPLIEQFRLQDIEVLVLEKNPDRVELQDGVSLSTDPADLDSCEHILCTASTLINGSLGDILENSKNAKTFSLIGPSGSGLPDVLFRHGIDAVGGIQFQDVEALKLVLDKQESWGRIGNKYQITRDDYPGIGALLAAARVSVGL